MLKDCSQISDSITMEIDKSMMDMEIPPFVFIPKHDPRIKKICLSKNNDTFRYQPRLKILEEIKDSLEFNAYASERIRDEID